MYPSRPFTAYAESYADVAGDMPDEHIWDDQVSNLQLFSSILAIRYNKDADECCKLKRQFKQFMRDELYDLVISPWMGDCELDTTLRVVLHPGDSITFESSELRA